MNVNNLMPNANVLHDSAYMILPEHHITLSEHHNNLIKRIRPENDKHALDSLIRTLAVAMFTERETVVTVWSDYEDQMFRGKITKLDKVHKTIRIENEEEYAWVPIEDVTNMEIVIDAL
ncbi:YolD-like protein [Paenibacillus sp. 1_12]|uniref:YolD-like family protein n=1 Tax=Paenibacillus sp. 1_12 TaxID=1566278 RepID=UPI0008E7F55C|nr:YolD-like family protein [Paenibacillus sp. 1_12]SFL06177.1 YolD-like protein [Paenibacillus sp. 1_12]